MGNDIKKRIGIGLLSGLAAGALVIGIGGRLAMRGIALMAGREGGFSWGGTFDVIALGLIIGMISGLIYGLFEKYGFFNTLLNGCLYGILVFLAILILPIDGKGAAKGFPDQQTEVYLIFGALFVLYGVFLATTFGRYFKKSL